MTTAVPCFTTGALIETQSGPRPIELLRVGDRIVTRDSGLRPIRWVGRKVVRGVSEQMAPVLIRKGAVDGCDEMRVSPQHRMVISGWHPKVLFGADEVM